MKKLFAKDKKNRQIIKQLESKKFILKQISTNSNFLMEIKRKRISKVYWILI